MQSGVVYVLGVGRVVVLFNDFFFPSAILFFVQNHTLP